MTSKRIVRVVSSIILVIALLNIYSYFLIDAQRGGKKLGFLSQPVLTFAKFPETVMDVFRETKRPERLVMIEPGFIPVNELEYDIFGLNGNFQEGQWLIRLTNLRNDSVLFTWYLSEKDYLKGDRIFAHSEPREPILLQDMSVIFACDESNNLFRLDKESKIIWHNTDAQYHHAINIADDGNVWVCSRKRVTPGEPGNEEIQYWDNFITKVDVHNGKTIYHKSVTQLLTENGYAYLVHGMGNQVIPSGDDPLHLNDIEPVMTNGPYWKKGDVFLSLRNRSLILLYRPETNEVLKTIQGPFLNQHDVDILSDTTITIFNNNVSTLEKIDPSGLKIADSPEEVFFSGIEMFNFPQSTFTSLMSDQFKKEKIRTKSQGLHTILRQGDIFVESQNKGIVYILSENEVILKKYYNDPGNTNLVERPHWVRIYEKLPF